MSAHLKDLDGWLVDSAHNSPPCVHNIPDRSHYNGRSPSIKTCDMGVKLFSMNGWIDMMDGRHCILNSSIVLSSLSFHAAHSSMCMSSSNMSLMQGNPFVFEISQSNQRRYRLCTKVSCKKVFVSLLTVASINSKHLG